MLTIETLEHEKKKTQEQRPCCRLGVFIVTPFFIIANFELAING